MSDDLSATNELVAQVEQCSASLDSYGAYEIYSDTQKALLSLSIPLGVVAAFVSSPIGGYVTTSATVGLSGLAGTRKIFLPDEEQLIYKLDQLETEYGIGACEIQSHFSALYPDKPLPNEPEEFIEALADDKLFRSVADGLQASARSNALRALYAFRGDLESVISEDKPNAPTEKLEPIIDNSNTISVAM